MEQLLFGRGHLFGLGVELVGVRPAGRGGLDVQVLGAFAGDPNRRADPFGQRGQPKPGLLGLFGAFGQHRERRLVGSEFRCGERHPGGRLVVITYHSIEDRLVKNFMKTGDPDGKVDKDFYGNITRPFELVYKKPYAWVKWASILGAGDVSVTSTTLN